MNVLQSFERNFCRHAAKEENARKKKESETKAQDILLRLVEETVDEDWFIRAVCILSLTY